VVFYVAIAVIGLAVLAWLALRLYRQVRQFARDVGAAGERIAAVSSSLEQLSGPTNRSGNGSRVVN
jgi:threonine/homoserine/homoserine lactone efflux protein